MALQSGEKIRRSGLKPETFAVLKRRHNHLDHQRCGPPAFSWPINAQTLYRNGPARQKKRVFFSFDAKYRRRASPTNPLNCYRNSCWTIGQRNYSLSPQKGGFTKFENAS
ncbi:uncharacterized protein TM35_000231020 [Trypanosoma theileri]|uniref:Uncharacterized protein n=1 Tax=Trypanosoma theileri TaxID=67003 RepID=A0A1X0NRA7_9TRYP|nr:uncharacterized protein TM35_000231020 [Trypanosoma theileri]ORC87131.1 hypothetical protein TM35_000231020 [Trypanosoma theileri]